MAWETCVQSQVESYQRLKKWYLMPPCLTLSIIRYVSWVKWSNLGKGVAPPPILWCSSYRKGSLRVTLDYGRQLHFTMLYLCCNLYRSWKWTRRLEFKSKTRTFASLHACVKGKNPITIPPQLWVNSRLTTGLGEGKLWIQNCWAPLKNDCVTFCLCGGVGWIHINFFYQWRATL